MQICSEVFVTAVAQGTGFGMLAAAKVNSPGLGGIEFQRREFTARVRSVAEGLVFPRRGADFDCRR